MLQPCPHSKRTAIYSAADGTGTPVWEASSAGDGDFFRAKATSSAVFVLPEPFGTVDREGRAAVIDRNDTPWAWYQLEDMRLIAITGGAALISYRGSAQPLGGDPFGMLMSSIWLRSTSG